MRQTQFDICSTLKGGGEKLTIMEWDLERVHSITVKYQFIKKPLRNSKYVLFIFLSVVQGVFSSNWERVQLTHKPNEDEPYTGWISVWSLN